MCIRDRANAISGHEYATAVDLKAVVSTSRKNTFHLASLAYWANTKDMLSDVAAKPWTVGKQQAKSYFVDVRESGSDGPISNQRRCV